MAGRENPSERTQAGIARDTRDDGFSFIELLVAIVLLGTVVVATLAGLRAAIVAGTVDDNHSKTYAWLQAASDAVAVTDYKSCASFTNAQITSAYQSAVNGATRPEGWTTTGALLVSSVQYLSRATTAGSPEVWGTTCAAGNTASPVYPQLITFTVISPDGKLTRSIEVIKSV
jgi:prepilin-type N-terminal cleavage/methylation domain-containing protein